MALGALSVATASRMGVGYASARPSWNDWTWNLLEYRSRLIDQVFIVLQIGKSTSQRTYHKFCTKCTTWAMATSTTLHDSSETYGPPKLPSPNRARTSGRR